MALDEQLTGRKVGGGGGKEPEEEQRWIQKAKSSQRQTCPGSKHCVMFWFGKRFFFFFPAKKITGHALTLFHIIQSYIQSGLEACSGED